MELLTFGASLEHATRMEDVWRQMVMFARERSVQRIAYHHLPPAAALDSHLVRIENEGFGAALLAQYLAARASGIAVLANAIQRGVRPVYLDELEERADLTAVERAHVAAYRAGGVANGLGVPAFGPHGRNGIFALDLGLDQPQLSQEVLAEVRWACQAMHLRYSVLLVPTLGELPALSPRETEVLLWVARGKSNAAVGEILGISAHTVDAHLRRIFLKLGVFDRISAALRGLGFGLIVLD